MLEIDNTIFLDIEDIAKKLKINTQTARRMLKKFDNVCIIGKRKYVVESELSKYILENKGLNIDYEDIEDNTL